MTDWNAVPPRGGPMVKVKGFPGPMYPPDADEHGKTPSAKTPFAEAIKRVTARIGPWPWDPEGWDESYSNGFAHGVAVNPSKGGVEAVQRWAKLDPTGWFGEKSFNFYRSVKVPQGRTHAGEMAMDSVAVGLIDQAYEDAHPQLPQTTVREAALKRAIGQLGLKEDPPESNETPFGEWYGEDGVPWCAIFTTWAYKHGADDLGKPCPSFQTVKEAGSNDRHDYVPYIVSDGRNGRYGFSITSSPKPGDLVCFDWNWNGEYDHVGLFEEWVDGTTIFNAVEGNTSLSNNSNGGEVMRRSRNRNAQGTVFVRVAEP